MSKSRRNIATAPPNGHTRKKGTAPSQKEMLRVVTGQTKTERSIIASHGAMKPLTVEMIPGVEFYRIWGRDTSVDLPSDGTSPKQPQYFPPMNGFRFGMFSLPPATSTKAPSDKTPQASSQQAPTSDQLEEMEQKLPGLMNLLETDHPGMHTSDSVDFDVVVFGARSCWS